MIRVTTLDTDTWRGSVDGFGPALADIYFTAEYHAMHEANGDGEARASLISDGAARLFVPGLRVPGSGACDLQTPNGYGGPLANTEATRPFLDEAWLAWRELARSDGIVAALFRLHPLVDNARWLPSSAVVRRERETVFVSLNGGRDGAWGRAETRHRNMVNKARRLGAAVEWNPPDGWSVFEPMYDAAMQRLQASPALRFSPPYFAALRSSSRAELALIRDDKGVAGAAVFFFGPRWAHYHLSARRPDAPNFATNALLQAAIERASDRRLDGLFLGGGTTNLIDDPLLRFKSSLGGERRDFHIALVVCDDEAYRHLIAGWRARSGRAPRWLLGYREPLP